VAPVKLEEWELEAPGIVDVHGDDIGGGALVFFLKRTAELLVVCPSVASSSSYALHPQEQRNKSCEEEKCRTSEIWLGSNNYFENHIFQNCW
jgi:hypothetical protein